MSSSSPQPEARRLAAIILAAGKGTRMESDLPKVVHPVAGEPMVRWVVEAARAVGASPIVLVVGHGAERVREVFAVNDDDLRYATQEPQLGTGHAVMQARQALGSAGVPARESGDGEASRAQRPGSTAQRPGSTCSHTHSARSTQHSALDVLVLCGDGPLIRAKTLRTLIDAHRRTNAAATLATSTIDDPTGYGRIVRGGSGRFERIVEHKDASPEQLALCEVNPSYYIFRAAALFDALDQVGNDNAKGEYYLTDVFPILMSQGERVEVVEAVPPEDVLSINTPAQLAQVSRILESRLEGAENRPAAAERRTHA